MWTGVGPLFFFVLHVVEFCSHIITNVSNNVQTTEIHKFPKERKLRQNVTRRKLLNLVWDLNQLLFRITSGCIHCKMFLNSSSWLNSALSRDSGSGSGSGSLSPELSPELLSVVCRLSTFHPVACVDSCCCINDETPSVGTQLMSLWSHYRSRS